MSHVLEFLKSQNGVPATRNTVATYVRGNKQYVLRAIDVLVDEGDITETPGARGAMLLTIPTSSSSEPVPEP